ncbi:MAG: hypothetical protein WBA12_13755 [Catalinimonas sp.]
MRRLCCAWLLVTACGVPAAQEAGNEELRLERLQMRDEVRGLESGLEAASQRRDR